MEIVIETFTSLGKNCSLIFYLWWNTSWLQLVIFIGWLFFRVNFIKYCLFVCFECSGVSIIKTLFVTLCCYFSEIRECLACCWAHYRSLKMTALKRQKRFVLTNCILMVFFFFCPLWTVLASLHCMHEARSALKVVRSNWKFFTLSVIHFSCYWCYWWGEFGYKSIHCIFVFLYL